MEKPQPYNPKSLKQRMQEEKEKYQKASEEQIKRLIEKRKKLRGY